jgi:peptidoglycan/LPS O-acetylase OafA/YrhL
MPYVRWISYGIYLFHAGVINILLYVTGMPTTWAAKLVFTLLTYALTIAVASLSYRYFEAPLLILKSRFATTPSAVPVSPAVAAPAAGSVQLAS